MNKLKKLKVKDERKQPKTLKRNIRARKQNTKNTKAQKTLKNPVLKTKTSIVIVVAATMHQIHRYHSEDQFLTLCVLLQ